MTVLTLNGKEYTLRLEYRELRRLEEQYNGRSFTEIISVLGENPSLIDMETMIYVSIQDKTMTRDQFVELLDEALSDPESGLSFDKLLNTFKEAVDQSVFIGNLQKQQEAEKKKSQLKKKKAI